jgi:hypothetical protein
MVEWTKQDFRDAARLLQVLEQRSNRRKVAGHLQAPAEIQDPAQLLENGGQSPSANSVGSAALKGSGRQSTVANEEEYRGSGYGSWLGSCVCDASMRQPAPCAGPNESGFTVEAQFEDEAWNVRDGSE